MSKYELTQERFNYLIEWLAGSCEESGEKYEEIRSSLIKYFSWNECQNPEDLADETINIVASKLPELAQEYKGDPARYFLGVARNLVKRKDSTNLHVSLSPEIKAAESDFEEEELSRAAIIERCQKECLQKLPEDQRKLILSYYKKGRKHDENFRDTLAAENKMNPVTLRVKIHRIRLELKKCLDKCKEEQ